MPCRDGTYRVTPHHSYAISLPCIVADQPRTDCPTASSSFIRLPKREGVCETAGHGGRWQDGAMRRGDMAAMKAPTIASEKLHALEWRLIGPFRGGRVVA